MTQEREEAERTRQGEMDELDRREREAYLCEKFTSLMKGDNRGATSSNTRVLI